MNEWINIVHICDIKYLLPTKTVVNSIIKNKSIIDKIQITIIGVGLDISLLQTFTQFEDKDIKIRLLASDECFSEIEIEHVHVSKAALYKMLLPTLLPDTEKVLYLDSDMLVMDSLYDLFSMELADKYVAAVRDFIGEKYQARNHKLHTDIYFNSGMMLLDLKKMREDKISELLVETRKEDSSNAYMDQDVFNKVMSKKVMSISPIYNYMQSMNRFAVDELSQFYGMSDLQMRNIRENAIIIHYTNRLKPWNSTDVEQWELWFEYLCKEDLQPVLSEIYAKSNKKIKELQQGLNCVRKQASSNVEYYEKGIALKGDLLSVSESMLFRHKDVLLAEIMKFSQNHKIVIYGAGIIGQFIYKLLYEAGLNEQVDGFAVSDEMGNVSSLFGKKVQELDKYTFENACVIYALKERDEYVLARISSFADVMDLSCILLDAIVRS